MIRVGVLCAFLLAFFSSHLWAQVTDNWAGRWDTYWRDGEARMLLQQQDENRRRPRFLRVLELVQVVA